jgi:hypothetical protein
MGHLGIVRFLPSCAIVKAISAGANSSWIGDVGANGEAKFNLPELSRLSSGPPYPSGVTRLAKK